uniref:hypothetical protein n=1 Tax=Crenothrix polyspora TaxID=360316 RepID=UPI0015C5F6DA
KVAEGAAAAGTAAVDTAKTAGAVATDAAGKAADGAAAAGTAAVDGAKAVTKDVKEAGAKLAH